MNPPLILPGQLGAAAPFSLTEGTYSQLVEDAFKDHLAELDRITSAAAEMGDITAAITAEAVDLFADGDTLDSVISLIDEADWGSPAPDLQPTTDYVTAQRDSFANASGLVQPIAPLTLVEPSGQAVITLGGPPSQGGVPTAGQAPYVLHLKLFAVGGGIHNVDADGGSGPNPPFAGFGPVVQETYPDGKVYWVYHVTINPQTPGTYTGIAQYIVNLTLTGITGTITRTLPFQVVVAK